MPRTDLDSDVNIESEPSNKRYGVLTLSCANLAMYKCCHLLRAINVVDSCLLGKMDVVAVEAI